MGILKKIILQHLSNLPGWRTDRKIIVFESDDWGSVRMPSKEAFNNLIRSGIPVDQSNYNRFDSLEGNSDLESLFEVISSFKDKSGNHPVFTGICVIANPDFDKIKASQYQKYFFEPFTETLKRYPAHDEVLNLWKEGAESRLFIPQYHGREHLNVQRWLRSLQSGDVQTLMAFENQFWGISTPATPKGYQAAFDLDYPEDLHYFHSVIEIGLHLFEELVGYRASFFVPPNGPFNHQLAETLFKMGVRYLTLDKKQKEPLGNGKYKLHYHYPGKRNRFNQIYLSRNASFEPSVDGKDWIDKCMKDIEIAFRMKKPATISTHRVNYIGQLEPTNRSRGLKQLVELLHRILKTWPEVEFKTSVELGDLIFYDSET
jgi:hypothetical protein